MNNEIYFDNAATTKPYNEVIQYMNEINEKYYGNPSSLHTRGIEAERLIKKAREQIARSLFVTDREIVFTSGGTEANNLAIQGYLNANPRKGKHIITSVVEHPSVLEVFQYFKKNGYEVDFVGVDETGIINIEELRKKIRQDTALISIMHVNNEMGAIQPIEEIARIRNAINKNTAIHIDGVQAFGKISFNVNRSGVDFYSVSSHKIHGPKGVGALFIRKGAKVTSLVFGGGQELSIRSGTENVAGIGGFGLAAETAFYDLEDKTKKLSLFKAELLAKLRSSEIEFKLNCFEGSSDSIINLSFLGVKSEVLLHHLEVHNIFVSTGSACSSRKNIQSHVLKAIGLMPNEIDGAIRLSFSHMNDLGEIGILVEALQEILPKIKIKNRK